MAYGISSGALRAALFAQRHPDRVARLALDAFVWTGEGAPTLVERRKKLPDSSPRKRRPIDRAFVHSIFARDHPDCAEQRVVDAFADAILALDDSMPNGTYIDMCSKLPVVDPARITVPTLVLRGQYDGIAALRRPDRVLQAAAESRQAVLGAWPASRTRASSRRTTGWSTTSCTRTSRSRPRRTSGRRTRRRGARRLTRVAPRSPRCGRCPRSKRSGAPSR